MLDITGKRFGRLTAVCPVCVVGTNWLWACQCDCGQQVQRLASHLRRGTTKSCGCLRRERAAKMGGRNRNPAFVVADMVGLRRLGFTYRVIGRMYKLSASRCCAIVKRAVYAKHS